jgi:hypothetical protein
LAPLQETLLDLRRGALLFLLAGNAAASAQEKAAANLPAQTQPANPGGSAADQKASDDSAKEKAESAKEKRAERRAERRERRRERKYGK